MLQGLGKLIIGIILGGSLAACGVITQDERDMTQIEPPAFEEPNGPLATPTPTPTPEPQAQFIASCWDCPQGNCEPDADNIDICRSYITYETVSAAEISKMADVIQEACSNDPDLRANSKFSLTANCKDFPHVIDVSLGDPETIDELTCQEDIMIDITGPDRTIAVEEQNYIAESEGSLLFEKNGGICTIVEDDD